jgi:hypothetical protein
MGRRLSAFGWVALLALLWSAAAGAAESVPIQAVRTVIDAVNTKDADKYVAGFAADAVVQMYGGPVRVRGREELKSNRAQHFRRFPHARSEIQHLVEIGPFVIMHDRVWLHGNNESPADIVEVFTFKDNLIVKVEVIQQDGLLAREPQ